MARHWLFPQRAQEATPYEVAVSGSGAGMSYDPVDNDRGFTQLGAAAREIPNFTLEKARTYSIAAYRTNPMARAIIDTYASFCVGDEPGVLPECQDPQVHEVVAEFWEDPRNQIGDLQALLFRDWLLMGEHIWEYLVGETTGVVRYSPIAPTRVVGVSLENGNPVWLDQLHVMQAPPKKIVRVDDTTGLRTGDVGYFPSWRSLITDRRGQPFLAPVIDDLDGYGQVMSNLIDRTALARYLVWDVEVKGGQTQIDAFIKQRGGQHAPGSGTVEVHNEGVTWKPQTANTGSFEDTNTLTSILTNVAGGTGLSKPWLAESEGANRATSMTMAEPVRRRIGGVQQEWLSIMTAHVRFAVDQAVRVGRLPRWIEQRDMNGNKVMVRPAMLARVVGPKIAAADSTITSNVMLNLSTAVSEMIAAGVLTKEAGAIAVQSAWAQFVGHPMPAGITAAAASVAPELTAEQLAQATAEGRLFLVS